VNEQFADALRRRLDGQFDQLPPVGRGELGLMHARQAEVQADVLTEAAAEALDQPWTRSLGDRPVSHEFLSAVPIAFARRHALMGLAGEDGDLSVALSDPTQLSQLDALAKILGKRVRPLFAPRGEILRMVNAAYQKRVGQAQEIIERLDRDQVLRELDRVGANEDLLDIAARAPVIKLVNLVLFEAVMRRASDVHFQPYGDRLVVRLRIDGMLHDVFDPPKALQAEVISRLKIMGSMNIAEHRIPQDGRATVEVGDRIVDLRIASMPTAFGERAVVRLLDKSLRLYELTELGMPGAVLEPFRRIIHADHGIVLVTGPTGSGKSTTLYAALQELNAKELNIVTLEDPIEYRLEGISQTQVSDRKGMTFASGLRSVLRQDPDIIMVGEIRDAETAQMAIQSALTGHLVFSTLHTNDASGAVARMLDLGVEPYLLASSLLGVLAQRLVRRICPNCRVPFHPDDQQWRLWQMEPTGDELFRGSGCDQCLQTGYRERVGVFELLTVDEPVREAILQRSKASTIKGLGVEAGMVTLRTDGLAKVARGVTTMEEAARVTGRDEF
jgi:general secretion pathway protein E